MPGFAPPTTNSFVANFGSTFNEFFVVPGGQNSWLLQTPLPDGAEYNFNLAYATNNATSVFVIGEGASAISVSMHEVPVTSEARPGRQAPEPRSATG